MPTYEYIVKADGEKRSGSLNAPSQAEALKRLRARGEVTSLKEVGKNATKRGALTLKERIIFSEQVSVMLLAGITLPQALRSLEEEAPRAFARRLYGELAADLEEGLPFSQGLAKHPRSFSEVFCQMVGSGEKTGNLADVLDRLTEQQRKEYELRGKVRGALMYPAVVSVLLVGVIILIITFVLPRLTGIFGDLELPASTRFLMALSSFMTTSWYLVIAGIVGLVLAVRMIGKTAAGRLAIDRLKLRVPVLGSFIRKAIVARFAQTFAFLAQAGVPVLDIFKTLRGVAGNAVYVQEIERLEKDVANGVPLSVSIRKSKQFPGMVGQLVKVGEQSGDLAGMFLVIGNFFEKEVDAMAKNLSTLLEPIIMIVMGAIIGFVLISVIQPMYGVINSV